MLFQSYFRCLDNLKYPKHIQVLLKNLKHQDQFFIFVRISAILPHDGNV